MKTELEEIIKKQQGTPGTPLFCVGMQLSDILSRRPQYEELVLQDLTGGGMNIAEIEKKISEYARNHKVNKGFGFCPPDVAEKFILEYFGIPADECAATGQAVGASADFVDVDDFI